MIEIKDFDAEAVSKVIESQLSLGIELEGKASLAIPGGRSPGPLLKELAKSCNGEIREKLYLYWVDERCVEIGHEDRNDAGMLAFWKEGGEEPAFVRSMPGENPDQAAGVAAYTETITQDGFAGGVDVSLLGIGEDAHFASLFPNHPMLDCEDMIFSLDDSPKPPPKRLSFSVPFTLDSKKVIVLVTGAGKGEVLKKAVQAPGKNYPVSLLFGHDHVEYYLDAAAKEAFEAN